MYRKKQKQKISHADDKTNLMNQRINTPVYLITTINIQIISIVVIIFLFILFKNKMDRF